jgi:hypothetical protein
MAENATTRHALPYLYIGQAQKEITHNEALVRIDALLHPVIQDWLAAPPPSLGPSSDGLCWLIAPSATGAWTAKDGQIARWTGGSWRFLTPAEGMVIWYQAEQKRLFYIGGDWADMAAIASPVGGTVVDVEARAAIVAILNHLRQISHIPS